MADPASPNAPNLRTLKRVVIVLGILILIAVAVLVVGLSRQASRNTATPAPAAIPLPGPAGLGFGSRVIDLPAGAEVAGVELDQGRVLVRVRVAPGRERLMLFDAATGAAIGTFETVRP